jgi:hypothetical protein
MTSRLARELRHDAGMKNTLRTLLGSILFVAACGGGDDGTSDLTVKVPPDLRIAGDGGAECVHDGDCGDPGYVCAYSIAAGCAAVGHCALLPTPTCQAIVEMCGCAGATVPGGGCFYQAGFAGGPTTGALVPACGDGGTQP